MVGVYFFLAFLGYAAVWNGLYRLGSPDSYPGLIESMTPGFRGTISSPLAGRTSLPGITTPSGAPHGGRTAGGSSGRRVQ